MKITTQPGRKISTKLFSKMYHNINHQKSCISTLTPQPKKNSFAIITTANPEE